MKPSLIELETPCIYYNIYGQAGSQKEEWNEGKDERGDGLTDKGTDGWMTGGRTDTLKKK